MSLLIVGSCSRITSNIIHALSKNNQYKNVQIADLLPSYSFHSRYYRLRKQLDEVNSTMKVDINKLFDPNQLYYMARDVNDVLFVTHDYFYQVSSKLKLMQLTAQACNFLKKKHVYFATPVEYDQYGYQNPSRRYIQAQSHALRYVPQATVIRSDLQDSAQTLYSMSKLLPNKIPNRFYPRIASSEKYASLIAETMKNQVQGKLLFFKGSTLQEYKYEELGNKAINGEQIEQMKDNVLQFIHKYPSKIQIGYQVVV